MAKADSILPFPDNIDRDAFGHWLSGFVDGEGCFLLHMRRYKDCHTQVPQANFQIKLRADDEPILRQMQSYWQCGGITFHAEQCRPHSKTCNMVMFRVKQYELLISVIIPHFEKFPLRAKKALDFAFWKDAVAFAAVISKRKQRGRQGRLGGGTISKWDHDERQHFKSLINQLIETRRFKSDKSEFPVPCKHSANGDPQMELFH